MVAQPLTLVWDTSPLYHSALADRLDVLGDMPWLDIVHVDGLDEIVALARWVGIMSASVHNRGEATVLAWAEVHDAVAIIDDNAARLAGQRHGLSVHGTLWVCASAVADGRIQPGAADGLIRALADTGARFPTLATQGFTAWAKAEGLLP